MPSLTLDWPVTAENDHQNVQVTAKMTLFYPELISAGLFETHSKPSNITLNLYTVSPEEYNQKYSMEHYSAYGAAIGFTVLWLFIGGPVVFLIYRSVDRFRTRREYRQNWQTPRYF